MYLLTARERWYMDPANRNDPKTKAFRLGLQCEARVRKEKIPEQYRELLDYMEIMCECHTELSSEEIARRVYRIFRPSNRWERIKRKARALFSGH